MPYYLSRERMMTNFFAQIHMAGRIALDRDEYEPRERLIRAVAELAKQDNVNYLNDEQQSEYWAILGAYKAGVPDEGIDGMLARIYKLAVSLRTFSNARK